MDLTSSDLNLFWGVFCDVCGKNWPSTDILRRGCAHRYLKCCSGKVLECSENSWELNYRDRSFSRWVIFLFFMFWLRSRRQWLATAGDFGKWKLEPGAFFGLILGSGQATDTCKSLKQAWGLFYGYVWSLFLCFSGCALLRWRRQMQVFLWSFDLPESRLRRSRWCWDNS